MLAEMLKDSLGEVRQLALKLAAERLAAGPLPQALREQVGLCLDDPDAATRQAAAVALAAVGGPGASRLLAARLEHEDSPQVRAAIFTGLGMLRDVEQLPRLVEAISREGDPVATAAAGALAELARKQPLPEQLSASAAEALTLRYQACPSPQQAPLREALLGAMGALRDRRHLEILSSALKDPAATVRLAAVKALAGLGQAQSLPAIAGLTGDPDRGVRLAAIAAVGTLSSGQHLPALLERSDPSTEPDAAVRQQAWQAVLGVLGRSDAAACKGVVDRLDKGGWEKEQLAAALRLWADKLSPEDSLPVRRRLGQTLLACNRPAEAAGELALVHAALVKAGDSQASVVWLQWVSALVSADDPTAAAAIADVSDKQARQQGLDLLVAHLQQLKDKKDPDSFIRLGEATQARLADRLPAEGRQELQTMLDQARQRQRQADDQRIAALTGKLISNDEATRQAAAKELGELKGRAVSPLLEQLHQALLCEDFAVEKAVLNVLGELAPRVKLYDSQASPQERLRLVEAALQSPQTQTNGS
jgi:HEAT repeat protein